MHQFLREEGNHCGANKSRASVDGGARSLWNHVTKAEEHSQDCSTEASDRVSMQRWIVISHLYFAVALYTAATQVVQPRFLP